jgi:ATP-dependent RNA helicase DDX18/HAS1
MSSALRASVITLLLGVSPCLSFSSSSPTTTLGRTRTFQLRATRQPKKSVNLEQRDDDPFGDYDDDGGYQYESSADDDDDGDDWRLADAALADKDEFNKPKSHFFSKKGIDDPSFRNSKLFDLLCEGVGIDRPSRIQSLAWPVLLEGKHTIVADQTGSGKTLGYLMPLLQRALQSIARENDRRNGAPRLLVLAPTAELADQIRAVCDKLAAKVPFRTMVITSTGAYATSIRDQIRLVQRQPIDVLISTPGRIATILRTRNSGLDLTSLQSIVLDEVDVLLVDETFGPQLRTVGVAAPLNQTQFVFVTATLPDEVVETVNREFPGVVEVRGPGLHRVAPTVKEHLVDVSVPSQYNRDNRLCFDVKAKQLLKALRQTRCRRTLVFCNTVDSCRNVENLLNRKDRRGQTYEVGAYHNAMAADSRNKNLKVFSNGKRGDDNVDYVLVCTDRAARGVDFDAAPVDHVILFDFPKDPAEYVRRVGRTARAGRTGTSTVLAYGWQLPIARKIMGSKLESFTVAVNDDDNDENVEFKGGVQGRRKQQRPVKGNKEQMIKGNIEQGRLWKNRKET